MKVSDAELSLACNAVAFLTFVMQFVTFYALFINERHLCGLCDVQSLIMHSQCAYAVYLLLEIGMTISLLNM